MSRAARLVTAAGEGDVALVRQLLDAGLAVDERDSGGVTALLAAVRDDRRAVAVLLLERGADVNAVAENRDTPWLLAGASGRAELLQIMVSHRPDLALLNRFGGTALIPACERGHIDAVRVLLTTAIDVDHVNKLGWTCLLELVILGDGGPAHQAIARLILGAGANPNLADRAAVSPVQHARRQGQRAIEALLTAAGGS